MVEDCGDPLAMHYQEKIRLSIPLTLAPQGRQEFPVTIYRQSNQGCVLTFSLLDDNQQPLTTAQVGIVPACPKLQTSIDAGLDYSLPEITTQSPQSSELPPQSSVIPPQSSVIPQNLPKSPTTLLSYQNSELNTAFDLLVEKGILTEQDKSLLDKPLSRIAAAELFVKIALINDLPKDSAKACEYDDMKTLSTDQQHIARLACQYNIMGIHPDGTPLEHFMPNDIIPSEQLVTAFSRLMWRNLYENTIEERYYELHMNVMYLGGLIDEKALHAPQKLADFVIIASRALQTEQLVLLEPTSSEPTKKEKSRFRFR